MFLNVLLNAFFPPVCPVCATRIETPGALCAECFSRLQFIHAHQPGKASAVVYDDTSKQLILALKYGDKTELAPLLARMMVNAGKEVLDGADLLTCVPLHWKRLLARKYNQAAVLASAVSKICAVPSDPLMLKRIKATPKQGTRRERFENVKDAFAFNPDRPVKGKIIVLIDDVVTTGATADACARELLKNGAGEVRLLTFAKAVGKN
ncbi:MAG: ComF family protein [Alphaproteobacteria bacterium]